MCYRGEIFNVRYDDRWGHRLHGAARNCAPAGRAPIPGQLACYTRAALGGLEYPSHATWLHTAGGLVRGVGLGYDGGSPSAGSYHTPLTLLPRVMFAGGRVRGVGVGYDGGSPSAVGIHTYPVCWASHTAEGLAYARRAGARA
jgi:hypothetical protein